MVFQSCLSISQSQATVPSLLTNFKPWWEKNAFLTVPITQSSLNVQYQSWESRQIELCFKCCPFDVGFEVLSQPWRIRVRVLSIHGRMRMNLITSTEQGMMSAITQAEGRYHLRLEGLRNFFPPYTMVWAVHKIRVR